MGLLPAAGGLDDIAGLHRQLADVGFFAQSGFDCLNHSLQGNWLAAAEVNDFIGGLVVRDGSADSGDDVVDEGVVAHA